MKVEPRGCPEFRKPCRPLYNHSSSCPYHQAEPSTIFPSVFYHLQWAELAYQMEPKGQGREEAQPGPFIRFCLITWPIPGPRSKGGYPLMPGHHMHIRMLKNTLWLSPPAWLQCSFSLDERAREIYSLLHPNLNPSKAGDTNMRCGKDCRNAERQKTGEHLERGCWLIVVSCLLSPQEDPNTLPS